MPYNCLSKFPVCIRSEFRIFKTISNSKECKLLYYSVGFVFTVDLNQEKQQKCNVFQAFYFQEQFI